MISMLLSLFSQCEITGDNSLSDKGPAADAAQSVLPQSDKVSVIGADSAEDTGDDVIPVAADIQDTSKTRREIYDEFIRANKDLFTEDTQKIINRRFKEVKQIQEALVAAKAQIQSLSEKLNAKKPCPPDNDFLASHPDFSLEKELENEVFNVLYNNGIPFDIAYSTSHAGEYTEQAVNDAIKATLDSVRARGTRLREAAASASLGTGLRRDVSKLTKNERADMARRAMAGEEIKLY